MDKKPGLEKFSTGWEVDVIGIDNAITLESVKQKVCNQCRIKIERFSNGEHSPDELCQNCTALIQTILGNKLL